MNRSIVRRIIRKIAHKGFLNNISDEKYLKLLYWATVGEKLNLKEPKTFNEKLQWLKLYDRKPEYTIMVDKYNVKQYVADKIGDKYVIPTLGVWDTFEEIDFGVLPNQFVLKCTHDSGGVVICKDKMLFDREAARKKINRSLKRNYFFSSREWPYKNVKPRIIAEKFMIDESGVELKDYKIFNFNGVPKLIEVDFARFSGHKRNLYTTDWEYINATIKYPTDENVHIDKPVCLQQMLELAHKLSDGYAHLRTDFYCINDEVFFGEITFYHGSGYESFNPKELGLKMGEWIELP